MDVARRHHSEEWRRNMPAITRIQLRLVTGNRADAGTDGDVFLGICGREFNVDSRGDVNDFERNSDRTYIFGEGANVLRPEENDPRSPWQLDLANIYGYLYGSGSNPAQEGTGTLSGLTSPSMQ
jgi:hypothetical protein